MLPVPEIVGDALVEGLLNANTLHMAKHCNPLKRRSTPEAVSPEAQNVQLSDHIRHETRHEAERMS